MFCCILTVGDAIRPRHHLLLPTQFFSFTPSHSLLRLLRVFARLEVLQREISSCDFKHFTRLSYSPPGSVLDSLIRAKMVLTLLGIPFSKMGVAFEVPPPASPSDRKEPFVRNCLNPSNLNPQGVLGLLSHHVTGQLRDLLVKWCRFRVEESEFLDARGAGESMSNYSDSASLTEVLLLFHRLDVTLVDVGEKGGYFPPRLDSASLREGHMHSESAGPAHLQYPSFAQKSSSRSRAQRQQVRVRGKGRERRSRSSEAFSRDASRSSDSSRSSVKSLPDQLIVETRVRYRGGSHRSPTNPSPYTYQPALSSPSHSAFVPPSPLKTSFATIIPSFRDIPQDEFVRTREMTPLKVSFAASVPSVREANHQDDHARNKDMAAFTECWARDPVSVKDALRLSYLILDFARLLVVARGMVLMTTEYGFSRPDWAPTNGPRTGSGSGSGQLEAYKLSVVHPLEMWQREVRAAKELKEKMRDAYSMVSDTADGALVSGPVVVAAGATGAVAVSGKNSSWLSDGLHSRLRLLDQLTGEDLLQYFRISKENNPQYSASRETLVRCIVLLLQSTGDAEQRTAPLCARELAVTYCPTNNIHDVSLFSLLTITYTHQSIFLRTGNQTLAEAASRLLRSSRIPLSSRGASCVMCHSCDLRSNRHCVVWWRSVAVSITIYNLPLVSALKLLLSLLCSALCLSGPTSRNMHGSPQQQSLLPSRWHSHTDSKDDGDWDPTRSRQTAVDSEDCHRIADALRALRVGDICPPRAVAPQERRSDRSPSSAPKRPSSATGEGKGKGKGSTGSEEYMIRLESICEEFLGPFDAPFPSASLHKTNTSPPMSPYKQNSPQYSAGAADKKAGKDNRNGTANGNGNVQIK